MDSNVISMGKRLRELEAKLLEAQTRPMYRPNDQQLKAFILEGNEHLSDERRIEYLSKIISDSTENLQSPNKSTLVNNNDFQSTFNPPRESGLNKDFLSLPEPPVLDKTVENFPSKSYSSNFSKSVLKFKASVPTPQGTERPRTSFRILSNH